MSGGFDPLVPREIDRPTPVPLDADVTTGPDALLLDDGTFLDVAMVRAAQRVLAAAGDGVGAG